MNYNINLKELSIRENEKVEWKENGNDKNVVKSIVKTISAFANDIANVGGGYVVCGAKEAKDEFGFPKVIYTGLSSEKLKTLEGKVLAHCRDHVNPSISPLVQEMDNPEDKTNQVKYPVRALQEALINAIVHRDYEILEPIRVTVFWNRIEITSPGALHWGVDREKFLSGKATAKWRNQSFAYLFNKLQLAQSEGQGIPTIFRTMREEGCPKPLFDIGTESVTCILPAHPRHIQYLSSTLTAWEL